MRRFNKANIPSLLIALAFSLILFFNVNSQNVSHFFSSDASYEEAVQNVPVTIQYNQKKYFVHGFTSTVAVKLASANRIQLNKEVDADTRSFSVVANLEGLSTGTHEVRLQTKNLQNSISATIDPRTVTVTIEDKETKKFDVSPVLSTTAGQTKRQLGEMSVDPESVEITTGKDTMKQIDRVIAAVDPTRISSSSDTIQAQVQALNANGESLPVQVEPQAVTVSFAPQKSTKEVELYPIQKGDVPAGIESYKIELNQKKATISGSEATLANITSIGVPVEIDKVTETVKKTIDVPTTGNYKVTPASVTAQITPVEKKTEETTSSSGAAAPTTSSQVQAAAVDPTEQTQVAVTHTTSSSVDSSVKTSETTKTTHSSTKTTNSSSVETTSTTKE